MIKYRCRYLDDRAKHLRWVDPRLSSVRVADLQAYLLAKGWKSVPPDRPGFLVYEEPGSSEGGPLYQFVPESEHWEGYPAQVYDLLAALAVIENRYAGDVLTDILNAAAAGIANGVAREQSHPAAVGYPQRMNWSGQGLSGSLDKMAPLRRVSRIRLCPSE